MALKLQHIQTLLDEQSSLRNQVNLYLAEVKSAQYDVSYAARNDSARNAANVANISAARITAAESGIRECHDRLPATQQAIDDYIAAQNLSDFDLAYLNLDGK